MREDCKGSIELITYIPAPSLLLNRTIIEPDEK